MPACPSRIFLIFNSTRARFSIGSVRTAAGTSVKSSLFHRWTRDTRDHPILGTRGARAQLQHELAGLGGGAAFYKAEGSLHASRVLHPGLVSQPFSLIFCHNSYAYAIAALLARRTRRHLALAQ